MTKALIVQYDYADYDLIQDNGSNQSSLSVLEHVELKEDTLYVLFHLEGDQPILLAFSEETTPLTEFNLISRVVEEVGESLMYVDNVFTLNEGLIVTVEHNLENEYTPDAMEDIVASVSTTSTLSNS